MLDQLAEDAAAFIANDGTNPTALLSETIKKTREVVSATDLELALTILNVIP